MGDAPDENDDIGDNSEFENIGALIKRELLIMTKKLIIFGIAFIFKQ